MNESSDSTPEDVEVEIRPGFDSGDVQCLGCGRTFHLWYNGGELDSEDCCGYTYATQAVDYQLVITKTADRSTR